MKIIIISLLLFSSTVVLGAETDEFLREEYAKAAEMWKTDLDSAITYSKEVLLLSEENDFSWGIAHANYLLGWLYTKKSSDYGKSMIHYLEAIRETKKGRFDEHIAILIDLYNNTGNIFKGYQLYDLALEYYNEGMELALSSNDYKDYIQLTYNASRTYKEMGDYTVAIQLLETCLERSELISHRQTSNIYNELGQFHVELHQFEIGRSYYDKLIGFVKNKPELYIRYTSYAYQNIGESYLAEKDFNKSIHGFKQALVLRETVQDTVKMFVSSRDLGKAFIGLEQYDSAIYYLEYAADLFESESVLNREDNFMVFKLLAEANRGIGNLAVVNQSTEKYYSILESFLTEQRQVEASDKQYNLRLITERYYTLLAQQEKTRSIQIFSGIGAGLFFLLIAGFIAFYYYKKYRLKREIENAIAIIRE